VKLARSPCDVLVLAAFDPELAHLGRALGPGLVGRVGQAVVEAKPVGIGLVAAAVGTAALLQGSLPRAVVLIGTCGAYAHVAQPTHALGRVVVGARSHLVDLGAIYGKAEIPSLVATRLQSDERICSGLAGAGHPQVGVATTLGITVDDEAATRIALGGVDVEHLETFSVASACQAAGVPFAALLGVANMVGSSAREQWRANHRAAADAAAAALLSWLERGGIGLPLGPD
jgi:nucleoside phosphorylase